MNLLKKFKLSPPKRPQSFGSGKIHIHWIRNLKTNQKLVLLVATMTVFMLIIGSLGFYYLSKGYQQLEQVYQNDLLPVKWLNELRAHSRANEALVTQMMLVTTRPERDALKAQIDKRIEKEKELLKRYQESGIDDFEQGKFELAMKSLKSYLENRDRAIQLALQNKTKMAFTVFQSSSPLLDQYNRSLDELAEYNSNQAYELDQQNKEEAVASESAIISSIFIGLILALILGWYLSRLISQPLVLMVNQIQKLSAGDLTAESLNIRSKDEIGQLSEALDTMVENLRGLIRQIQATSTEVAASSQQLSSGAEQTKLSATHISTTIQQMASGMQIQEMSSEETVRAIEEMASGVQRIAESASTVSNATMDLSQQAQTGNETVQNVVKQMSTIQGVVGELTSTVKDLGNRSQNINEFVKVIRSIASQTDLLALNAAIEAARAGEVGRGFAVVASEVRKLAVQSEASAREIAQLVEEILGGTSRSVKSVNHVSHEVEAGMKVVHEAGEAFGRILHASEAIASQTQEVSAATEELSAGSEEIAASVHEVKRSISEGSANSKEIAVGSQQQLSTMENVADSASSLSQLAQNLLKAVSQFKI
jgi:methyl-accepting chemotaxis protein